MVSPDVCQVDQILTAVADGSNQNCRRLFNNPRFVTIFVSAALGTFPLFVPPFFLPLYGESMGLSHSSSAGLVAGFNLASAVGRIGFGQLADVVGPINALVLTFFLNTISLLVIWPVSHTLGPLIVFVIATGIAAGTPESRLRARLVLH
jgi:MFS family permease